MALAAVWLESAAAAQPRAGSEPRRSGTALRGASADLPPADWQRPERWAALRVGMSQAQVLGLLGEPGRITHYYAFERWEYPDALGRRVNFDERGRLSVWGPLAR